MCENHKDKRGISAGGVTCSSMGSVWSGGWMASFRSQVVMAIQDGGGVALAVKAAMLNGLMRLQLGGSMGLSARALTPERFMDTR